MGTWFIAQMCRDPCFGRGWVGTPVDGAGGGSCGGLCTSHRPTCSLPIFESPVGLHRIFWGGSAWVGVWGGVSEVVLAWVAVQAVARCFCSSSSNNRRSDVHTHVLGTRFLDPITLLGGMHSGVAPPPPWLLLLLLLPSVLCSGMSRRWWSWWFSFPVCIHCGLCCLLPTPCDLFGWNKPAQLHPVLCQQAACDRMLL